MYFVPLNTKEYLEAGSISTPRYFQYVNLIRCEILMLTTLVIILSILNMKKNVPNNSWGCFVMFNYKFIDWFYYKLCLKKKLYVGFYNGTEISYALQVMAYLSLFTW